MQEEKHKKNYFRYLKKLEEGRCCKYQLNRELILRFLKDCEMGKTILKGQKKKIGYGRLSRLAGLLVKMDTAWLKVELDKVTQEQMDSFILNLERGLITHNGNPYTSETQKTMKKVVRKFYKWLFGNNETYPALVRYIDTSGPIPEIKAILKDDVDRMISGTGSLAHKFLIATLFDSGARAQEYFNLKIKDIAFTGEYYQIRISKSKTKPRTISLPLYTDLIKEYLEWHPQKENSNAALSVHHYDSAKKILKRVAAKTLSVNVYCHKLRHSSATFYANHLTHYQMCNRYGWAMSSDMPNRYIDFAGIREQETAAKIMAHQGQKQMKEQSVLRSELDIMKQTLLEMKNQEELRRKEQDLHNELFKKLSSYDNKDGLTDVREMLYQILKKDNALVDKLRQF